MRSEIEDLIAYAEWYYVYDAIELVSKKLPKEKNICFLRAN